MYTRVPSPIHHPLYTPGYTPTMPLRTGYWCHGCGGGAETALGPRWQAFGSWWRT